MLDRIFTAVATRLSSWVGDSIAFILALAVVIAWGITGPIFHYSDTWQLIINTGTTIVTFLMVFLIQNAQNRDAAAMQAKLDELIRAIAEARGQFIGIEHRSDADIQQIRAALEAECATDEMPESGRLKSRNGSELERLLRRR